MAKQSLKTRLWINTGLNLLLLIVVCGLGVFAILTSIGMFNKYHNATQLSNAANKIHLLVLNARVSAKQFLSSMDDKDAQAAMDNIKELDFEIVAARGLTKSAGSQEKLSEAAKMVQDYAGSLEKMRAQTSAYLKAQAITIDLGPKILNATDALCETAGIAAHSDKLPEAGANPAVLGASAVAPATHGADYLEAATLSRYKLILARMYVWRFYAQNKQDFADVAGKALDDTEPAYAALKKFTAGEDAKKLQFIIENLSTYKTNLKETFASALTRNDIQNNELLPEGAKIQKVASDISEETLREQSSIAHDFEDTNRILLLAIFLAAVINIAVASVLSVFLISSITSNIRLIIDGLTASSQSVGSAANQIAASSQSLAEASSQQAATVEETSASMEEISSMVKTNSQSIEQVKDRAVRANEATVVGTQKMGDLSKKLDKIRDSGNALKAAIAKINQSSKEVAQVTSTINEIAFQTNLLSLNAAVEAARAGEAGAGFAVVAGEVGQLAQRSASNASQTAQLIDQAGDSSKEGVVASNEVLKSLDEATKIFSEVTQAFSAIATQVCDVSTHVEEVKQASNQQTSGIEQINIAVGQLDQVIQQNAATSEESAGAAAQLTSQADELRRYVEQLNEVVYGSKKLMTYRPEAGNAETHPKMFPESGQRVFKSDDARVSFKAEGSADVKQIIAAIGAHGKWKGRLKSAIEKGVIDVSPEKAAMDNQCEFGKWLYSLPGAEQAAPEVRQIKELHARFHRENGEILRLVEKGEKEKAARAIAKGSAYEDLSKQLVGALQSWSLQRRHATKILN